MSVRYRSCNHLGSNNAACAGPVINNHLMAHLFCEFRGKVARGNILSTSRCGSYYQSKWSVWVGLRTATGERAQIGTGGEDEFTRGAGLCPPA